MRASSFLPINLIETRPHQQEAITNTIEGFKTADRGKIIMACAQARPYTSLKIAEQQVGAGGRVLFLVPSLALAQQSIRGYITDSTNSIRAFAVCSDSQVGKHSSNDTIAMTLHDLDYPATTDSQALADAINSQDNSDKMIVVFSTYQSISVIEIAQKEWQLDGFDLIICDEAHRTTGVVRADKKGGEDKHFTKIHNNDSVKGKKRLYMTATPKIYGEQAKQQKKHDARIKDIYSMNDKAIYGGEFYRLGFATAVKKRLLTDYKLIVMGVSPDASADSLEGVLSTKDDYQLTLEDATKVIGCHRAISKLDNKDSYGTDNLPMKRVLAFCSSIKLSKSVAHIFNEIVDQQIGDKPIQYSVKHVDGKHRAQERGQKLQWLDNTYSRSLPYLEQC